MPVCYIVGAAATCAAFEPTAEDIVIAADGGQGHLRARGLTPNWTVGDFDSSAAPVVGQVRRHPVEKDDTDTMLAVKLGWEQGCREFRIYAGTGGRSDHTLANLQTLGWLSSRGGRGYLVGEGECFTMLRDGTLRLRAREQGMLSLFAHGGEARGVTLAGLHYPLQNAIVTPDFPIGVSNHFTGKPVSVTVTDGTLLVYWDGDVAEVVR